MMPQVSAFVSVFCTLLFTSSTVFGDDSRDADSSSHVNDEYSHIHRSIPVLFEYLLVALEGKPEVLESNSAVAFNDPSNDEKVQSKRNADYDNFEYYYDYDNVESDEDYFHEDEGEYKTVAVRSLDENNDEVLDPEEIERKILLAEEKLEEHNNKKK